MNKVYTKLVISQNSANISIDKDTKITIISEKLEKLTIVVQDNCAVIVNDFRIISKSNTNINLSIKNNSSIIYSHSFINQNIYGLNIKTEYAGSVSSIVINIHGINDKGIGTINIDGQMGANFDNSLLENIKLININSGYGTIIPNILVNNSQIVANHKATIGTVSKVELAYLMSKGICKKEAEKLILTGFLIGIYDDMEFVTKTKERII